MKKTNLSFGQSVPPRHLWIGAFLTCGTVFFMLLLLVAPAPGAAINLAFLGIQTENSKTFQGQIYDRIYNRLSLNPNFNLISRKKIQDIYDYQPIKDILLTADEANEIYNRFDSHIILSIKIVEWNLEKGKYLWVLPFGYAQGRIKYQIVIWNAMRMEPKFQGDFEICSRQSLGYCGFSPARESVVSLAEQQKELNDKLNTLLIGDIQEKLFHGLSGVNRLSMQQIKDIGIYGSDSLPQENAKSPAE